MNEERANAIYDVLVEGAGARNDADSRFEFVHHILKGCTEFRFMGKLGFGGKYWQFLNRVNCYPEDETPERAKVVAQTNAWLFELDYELDD